MMLPRAPDQYDRGNEQQTRDAISRDGQTVFRAGRDMELARGERLILRSPNGSRWYLTVSDAGVLSVAAL